MAVRCSPRAARSRAPAGARSAARRSRRGVRRRSARRAGSAPSSTPGREGPRQGAGGCSAGGEGDARAETFRPRQQVERRATEARGQDYPGPASPRTIQGIGKQATHGDRRALEGTRGDRERASWQDRSAQMAATQSPATTRAIEHARAGGPTLREQADAARAAKGTDKERAEKIVAKAKQRIGSLNDQISKTPQGKRGDKVVSRLIPKISRTDTLAGRAMRAGGITSKVNPATTLAIEHARAAQGPSLREQADAHRSAKAEKAGSESKRREEIMTRLGYRANKQGKACQATRCDPSTTT